MGIRRINHKDAKNTKGNGEGNENHRWTRMNADKKKGRRSGGN
jgi:hypothetical protein